MARIRGSPGADQVRLLQQETETLPVLLVREGINVGSYGLINVDAQGGRRNGAQYEPRLPDCYSWTSSSWR